MVPDILFPFAAPPVSGSLEEAGTAAENQARVLLWGVERLIGGLSRIGEDTHVGHRLHVVLPGSPNRGTFGGDGAYGEVKAAFDAIVNKWAVERWGRRVSIAHAIIGWVRGTGLMGRNDPLVAAVEAAGVRTWDTSEISAELVGLCAGEAREAAAREPVIADFTGARPSPPARPDPRTSWSWSAWPRWARGGLRARGSPPSWASSAPATSR